MTIIVNLDVMLAKRLMAWHGTPLDSVCRHPVPHWPNGTLSTTVFLPGGTKGRARPSFLFCNGSPCQSAHEYEEVAV